ncbi:dehydrogenase/reductase SDR family member 4-like isoform X2 [Rana temporaria]|uniref:dehydrogenase/reductase SDR family member 4-like isoform X2 n=1 Tax=Rana temporaria TaxID=8407 RepID=UPI001AADD3D0|nr:dehydrogenase/reductase SDR family member 4-like isoform X2 [Rana temporaria]
MSQENYQIKSSAKNQKPLQDKVAIVTGSTYGIGFAIARRLAQDGAHVLLCSRKTENVDKAVKQLKEEGLSISGIPCHVGNEKDREKLVATALDIYGKIDILVCNAAVNPFVGPLFETTEELWNKYIGPYSITKTSLHGLTNMLAQALRFMNIRVNSLALGLINTSFSKVILKTPDIASKLIPLGVHRMGEPEECAGIASFLCSEDASYINGENIGVTGGMLGRL